ncbi:glycoside hydrolase family 3 N-terminal domain-containing protein [Hyphococcus flavus]|uniref:beta-N-acetylhexosaminidase n=1 Tax=Hyphococcus flavus TaxID=1866326 RepID=A0AAE9ZDR4_9PROT|nr:glycoside hydrolase family 3 N-terminal domain-containing protein [Hyphococcus flavus]WDI30632.1 glycoside hydrolase family 3 N-terminal domain-containing protein [Hyphococcus flavus]
MPTAAIFDCEGPRLTAEEKAFFRDVDPWGFILFARHCENADNVRAHCDELRECVGREDAPILIDQEGGRVVRLKPPAFPAHPPASVFGELWKLDPAKANEAARLNGYLLGRMVSDLGVNVNCVPMIDVPQPDADPVVIGDRVFAKWPDVITTLAHATIEGSIAGGALPVMKHMPGHGRALCDSHFELPRVCNSKRDLQTVDFETFKSLRDVRMGMTAHIVYEAYDAETVSTLSSVIINDVIRGEIGFDGLLMTDDLKMKALGGPIPERITRSYEAGCDIALNCNFTLAEKKECSGHLRPLEGKAAARAAHALEELGPVDRTDTGEAYERLNTLLKPVKI